MKKPETKFRESTYPFLNSLKNCFWESIQQIAIKSTCDIIMCIQGRYVGMEYKKDEKTKPRKHQIYKHKRIVNKGKGRVLIPCPENWHLIKKELKRLTKLPPI